MKGLKLLLLTFATLAITACSDDTTDEWHGDFGSIQVPDTRQLSQKIPAGQTAGNSEIFFSTNDAWNSAITDESRAEAPTWVRINPDHGDAAGDYDIRVETDPNTAEESRTAFIEITCGTNSILITITQPGTDGEDTNEPDEPNIGEQVRYWQLHKIVGRDASGSLIAEMEYTYELPAEFSKECRITGFKNIRSGQERHAPSRRNMAVHLRGRRLHPILLHPGNRWRATLYANCRRNPIRLLLRCTKRRIRTHLDTFRQ